MRVYLVIGLGGFIGAVTRYWLGGLFKLTPGDFPAGTFLINLSGSLVLGFFLTILAEHFPHTAPEWRLFFGTGVVGSYTTFSTFSLETLSLLRQGYLMVAILYILLSLVGGLVMVWIGFRLAHRIG